MCAAETTCRYSIALVSHMGSFFGIRRIKPETQLCKAAKRIDAQLIETSRIVYKSVDYCARFIVLAFLKSAYGLVNRVSGRSLGRTPCENGSQYRDYYKQVTHLDFFDFT